MNANLHSQAKKRLFKRKAKRYTKASCLTAWRLVLFAVMLLLLLACIAWIIFLRTFNAQHLSEMITYQLQKSLNRPVMISSLELKFLNAVELKGFYIVDTQGEPGKALVAADSVTLTFEILPLLDQKLVIHEVTLNAPRFNLVRTQERTYNIPRIKLPKDEHSTYTSAAGRKFEVSIENWRIKDGIFSFKDLSTSAAHAVYGLNAQFHKLRFNEPSDFSLETVLRNEWKGHISEMEIETTGQVNFADFDWQKSSLNNVQTQVQVFKKPLELLLDVENFIEPSFHLTAQIPAFDGGDLSVFGVEANAFAAPASLVALQGTLTDNYQKLTVQDLNADIGDIKLTASGQADFAVAPISWQAQVSTQPFALAGKETFITKLAQYRLSGQASVSGQINAAKGKYTLPSLSIQAQKLTGDFYGFKVAGASGEFQAKNNFSDIYARTTNGKLTVANSVFDKLQLSGSWRAGNLYGYIDSATLNEVPVKVSVEIADLKQDDRRIRTHLHFANFDPMAFIGTVQDFITVITPLTKPAPAAVLDTSSLAWLRNFRDRLPNFMPNFAGTLSADTFSSQVLSGSAFNAEFDFTGLTAGGKALSGPLAVHLKDGTIHQMEKLAAEQSALNVTFQPFIMMHRMERAGSFSVGKVLRDVEVTELAAAVNFNNGAMQINNAYTVGPTISAAVSGQTDWVNENLDITIYTMFTNTSKSGVLAENLTDESGNPALAFRVSSSMQKPKLEMLRAKKAGQTIRAAQAKGALTDFEASRKFIQGEFHATK